VIFIRLRQVNNHHRSNAHARSINICVSSRGGAAAPAPAPVTWVPAFLGALERSRAAPRSAKYVRARSWLVGFSTGSGRDGQTGGCVISWAVGHGIRAEPFRVLFRWEPVSPAPSRSAEHGSGQLGSKIQRLLPPIGQSRGTVQGDNGFVPARSDRFWDLLLHGVLLNQKEATDLCLLV
jgi:hypothetical protein